MAREKAKDDKYFSCDQEHEKKYVSGLYTNSQAVYNYLTKACADNTIKYSTHKQLYELILKNLGYPIPN